MDTCNQVLRNFVLNGVGMAGNTDNAAIRVVYVFASNFEIDEKVIEKFTLNYIMKVNEVVEAKTEVRKAVALAMSKERALFLLDEDSPQRSIVASDVLGTKELVKLKVRLLNNAKLRQEEAESRLKVAYRGALDRALKGAGPVEWPVF